MGIEKWGGRMEVELYLGRVGGPRIADKSPLNGQREDFVTLNV